MVDTISINALLIVVWVAAMWAIGPERIVGFKHIPALMALATSGAMLAAARGVNPTWNRRSG
ncbi:MAG TPA: hypothetical protein VLK82_02650 [Candidatus Tectomicrobia bacterium]|nr:hypothetical protein [Candidatus Tectomicrobia bacterium]